MAWGLFNKIKKGFKEVGSAFKKTAGWVNDKVIKPMKPIIKTVANSYVPGSGMIVDAASAGIDAFTKGDWDGVRDKGKEVAQFIREGRGRGRA